MKNLLLLVLFISSITLQAQLPKSKLLKPGTITGKVVDNTSKEPLPYVNIVVRDFAKKILTGGITNENGIFIIKDIPEGNSLVEAQFIGYKTYSTKINISNKNNQVDLGTIFLLEDSSQLNEVVVRAETSQIVQKVDRKVINVGKDLTATGTTASELLNNVQSVNVDSQTGNISLRGNENVRVLVDGKPTNISAAQLLKQIPSTSIKSIELITNPSAKYNPEGMSGIINIILNKNANMGFNGSIDTGVTAGHYVRYNASTNMNYKTGKVNFFGNYGYNGGNNYNYGFVNRPAVGRLQDFIFQNDNQSHLIKAGADIYLDKKNTLSFYTTQNWFDGDGNGRTLVTENGTIVSKAPNVQLQNNQTGAYNVNYKREFEKEGHNIEFEATYSNTRAPEDAENKDVTKNPNDVDFKVLNFFNDITNKSNNTLLNVDYTNPVSEKGKLELGLEYREDNTSNINITNQDEIVFDNQGNPTIQPLGNSDFDYGRKIYSAYANYGHQFGKVTMQLGARFEQFKATGNFNRDGNPSENVNQDIFSVYPSAFFTFNLSDKNQFQLSYSRRVDRPGISQVNPIREWSTPLITSIGNANLLPQFTNSFEANYTRQIKNGSVTFGTFYRAINDNISRVTYKDPNDPSNVKQVLSWTNFEDTNAYGLEFSFNYKIANWWRVNSSMDFYSQKQFGTVDLVNANAQRIEVTNEVFNARVSNSFKVSKRLNLQLFAMYRGPQEDIQWKTENMWMLNTGASLRVLDGKGSINFRVNDIFRGMKFAFNSENPFVQNGRFNWESQTAYIGFNYRFGSGKNKAKQRRQRDDNIKEGGASF
ncbi:TonB-dependent receptor [Polaribacter batillariae]|uniref:TonB-dependent receptor n=1 Tax=Polaribacter batillariae TaxID=2808900 RepID=A0ABX7SS95_9FLAO|nr:outer membrane beta-barrel family protein [Polaribacter batillariae]QTD37130.1 TonB-dependent receptor [Polaribacter batillariae]